jgi:hypothetical protein
MRYNVIGLVMALSPVSAAVLDLLFGNQSYIFFIESAGIMAFGWYWLAKSSELKHSAAEAKALAGKMSVR